MKKLAIIVLFVAFGIIISSQKSYCYQIPNNKNINPITIQKGISKYSSEIQGNPNLEEPYINRAFLYLLNEEIDNAIADYDTLIKINPNNEEFYLNRGYLNHISNKREAALKDYDMALKIKPDYAFAHNNRGVVLAELGRKSESLSAYNTAIKIDPNYADAYYNRGNLKTQTEKNEEALEDFNTAIKLNPTDSASFNNRGVVKRKLNYNIGALSDFSIAIRLDPEDITAFANRGRLKKRYYDSEGAEEDFKNAIAIAEESPILVKEVELHSQLVKQKEAQLKNAILEEKPKNSSEIQKIAHKKVDSNLTTIRTNNFQAKPQTQENVGSNTIECIVQKEKTSDAPAITTKPVENPQLAECYFIRALQKYILQKRESALADFDMAIKHNPNYAEAYYYRAAIKRDFKDSGFVDDYTKAVALNPNLKSVNEADVLMILK